MQTPSLLLLLGAIITGAVVPFQAGGNAAMGRALGHPLWGSVVSLCVSLICIAPILAVARVKAPALGQLAHTPPWVWIGGMVGLLYITGALMLMPRLGAAGFIVAALAGQMLASVLIDHFGLVGLAARPVDIHRLAGLALVMAGLLVMQGQALWSRAAT